MRWGKVAGSIVYFYLLNASFVPLNALFAFGRVTNPRIPEHTETRKYAHRYTGDPETRALAYLKLANAITTKYLSYGETPGKGLDALFRSRIGNCSKISEFTYANFLELLRMNNEQDLETYVRGAVGIAENRRDGGGHAWLELRIDDTWYPFETTAIDLNPGQQINPAEIDLLLPTEKVFNMREIAYHRTNIVSIKNGGRTSDLDIDGVLTNYRGSVYVLTQNLRD